MDRHRVIRLRGALAPAIVLLSIASLFGVTHTAASGSEPVRTDVVSVATGPPRATPFVTGAKLSSAVVDAARSNRVRSLALDAFLLAAAFALALTEYGRRVGTRLRHLLRVDAVFARRRGPPLLPVVS